MGTKLKLPLITAHKIWQFVLGRFKGFSFPLFCRATKKYSEALPHFIAKPLAVAWVKRENNIHQIIMILEVRSQHGKL